MHEELEASVIALCENLNATCGDVEIKIRFNSGYHYRFKINGEYLVFRGFEPTDEKVISHILNVIENFIKRERALSNG